MKYSPPSRLNIGSKALGLAHELRRVAIEIVMPHAGKVREDQDHRHSDGSSFTDIDLAAEDALKKAAQRIYPEALITGEEAISENPDGFLREARNHTVIIFDPIDGTGAFKRGEDTYCVMAAVVNRGVTEAGIIYTPGHSVADANGILMPQKDILVITERGQGTYLSGQRIQLNKGSISLREHARIAFALFRENAQFIPTLSEGVPSIVSRKNSGSDYTWMLQGEIDATFYSEGAGKSPPWDHAAGVLAIQEAGGYAALPYGDKEGGEPYDPLCCYDRLLVARSRSLFENIHGHVRARAPALTAPQQHTPDHP